MRNLKQALIAAAILTPLVLMSGADARERGGGGGGAGVSRGGGVAVAG